MKITLYTPDGTAQTYSGCVIATPDNPNYVGLDAFSFTGTDWRGERVGIITSLQYLIDVDAPTEPLVDRVLEIVDRQERRQ